MTIEDFNSRLTNRCEVIVPTETPMYTFINHTLIDRIKRFYKTYGAPSVEEIDRQNKRVQQHCKSVMG